jgi:hypothetical protein
VAPSEIRDDLELILPTNWNVRPVGPNAQSIAREFLAAVDRAMETATRS